MKNKKELVIRYLIFIVGLFIASMGVAFSKLAGLGTSPVASVPNVVSLVCPILTFGWWLNVWSLLQISVQVILLKKECNPLEIFIQTILAFAYGWMTDFSYSLVKDIKVSNYVMQIMYMLIGCLVLAFGIWIQFKGGVAMLPGEAMNRAIAQVTGKKYENVKIFFDIAYIAAAAVISFVAFGKLNEVREGSIIAAFLVGIIIKVFNKIFDKKFSKRDKMK